MEVTGAEGFGGRDGLSRGRAFVEILNSLKSCWVNIVYSTSQSLAIASNPYVIDYCSISVNSSVNIKCYYLFDVYSKRIGINGGISGVFTFCTVQLWAKVYFRIDILLVPRKNLVMIGEN